MINIVPRGGIEVRKNFFEQYAKINNFDPQVAENWYSQPLDLIMSHKVFIFSIFLVLSYF